MLHSKAWAKHANGQVDSISSSLSAQQTTAPQYSDILAASIKV